MRFIRPKIKKINYGVKFDPTLFVHFVISCHIVGNFLLFCNLGILVSKIECKTKEVGDLSVYY